MKKHPINWLFAGVIAALGITIYCIPMNHPKHYNPQPFNRTPNHHLDYQIHNPDPDGDAEQSEIDEDETRLIELYETFKQQLYDDSLFGKLHLSPYFDSSQGDTMFCPDKQTTIYCVFSPQCKMSFCGVCGYDIWIQSRVHNKIDVTYWECSGLLTHAYTLKHNNHTYYILTWVNDWHSGAVREGISIISLRKNKIRLHPEFFPAKFHTPIRDYEGFLENNSLHFRGDGWNYHGVYFHCDYSAGTKTISYNQVIEDTLRPMEDSCFELKETGLRNSFQLVLP